MPITMILGMEEYTMCSNFLAKFGADWGGCVGTGAPKVDNLVTIAVFGVIRVFPPYSLSISFPPLTFPSFLFILLPFPALSHPLSPPFPYPFPLFPPLFLFSTSSLLSPLSCLLFLTHPSPSHPLSYPPLSPFP